MLSQALKTRFKTSIDNAGFQFCVLDLKQHHHLEANEKTCAWK